MEKQLFLDLLMNALIVLRGLPGSGKSTLAGLLSENGKWPAFSIDDYFTDPQTGAYTFIFSENHLAYQQCVNHTEKAMIAGTKKILLHNTFTLAWEIEPYFKLAAAHHYILFVATVENYHNGKNTHGIEEEQLQKMAEKYKVKLF